MQDLVLAWAFSAQEDFQMQNLSPELLRALTTGNVSGLCSGKHGRSCPQLIIRQLDAMD